MINRDLWKISDLLYVVFVSSASYIKICYQDDPKLNQCVKESIEALRPKLAEGMPELDVPTLEPLHIPQIELANSPSFKAAAQMVKFYDFTKFKIESLDIDLEKGTIFVILRFDKIRLDAQYAVNAKLGPAIIAGKGPIDIIASMKYLILLTSLPILDIDFFYAI